jgi:hypothetical protein
MLPPGTRELVHIVKSHVSEARETDGSINSE